MSKIVLVGLLSVLFVLSGCSLSNVAYATGSVVDQNGVAIQGARVVFDGEGLYLVQFTDEAGNYKIKDLQAGNYEVSTEADGCDALSRSYHYSGGNVEMDLEVTCG